MVMYHLVGCLLLTGVAASGAGSGAASNKDASDHVNREPLVRREAQQPNSADGAAGRASSEDEKHLPQELPLQGASLLEISDVDELLDEHEHRAKRREALDTLAEDVNPRPSQQEGSATLVLQELEHLAHNGHHFPHDHPLHDWDHHDSDVKGRVIGAVLRLLDNAKDKHSVMPDVRLLLDLAKGPDCAKVADAAEFLEFSSERSHENHLSRDHHSRSHHHHGHAHHSKSGEHQQGDAGEGHEHGVRPHHYGHHSEHEHGAHHHHQGHHEHHHRHHAEDDEDKQSHENGGVDGAASDGDSDKKD